MNWWETVRREFWSMFGLASLIGIIVWLIIR